MTIVQRLVFIFAIFFTCAGLRAQVDESKFAADMAALTSAPTRVVGTPGHEQATQYIIDQIKQVPGVELQVHEYPVMTPATASATLSLPGGRTENVFPLWPASVRLNTTPLEGIAGQLVYCKDAEYNELKPTELPGQIAVVEATAGVNWSRTMYFGARAVLILGSKEMTYRDLRAHDIPIPVNFPRFFVPEGPLAQQLRAGLAGQATIKASGRWKRSVVKNLYALVRPQDALQPPPGKDGKPGKAYGALAIVAPIDSTGYVVDQSPGASQAVQCATALSYLRDFAAHPPRRPVLVCFTAADGINLQGTRNMLMTLVDAPLKWQDEIDELKSKLDDAQLDDKRLTELAGDPTKLDITRDRRLIDRIVKIIETDITLEQDELFRLRLSATRTDAETKREKELESRQIMLSAVRYQFLSGPEKLTDQRDVAVAFLQRTTDRLEGNSTTGDMGLIQYYTARQTELWRRQELFKWLAAATGRNPNPPARSNADRLIEVMIGLDLSDRGVRVGPICWGQFARAIGVSQIQDLREWFDGLLPRKDRPGAEWFTPLANYITFEPLSQTRTALTYLGTPLALPTELGIPWGTPAMTFATLEDLRVFRDTPNDTLANCNLKNIYPQARALETLLRQAFDAPKFVAGQDIRRYYNAFVGQVVSSASGRPIPDLPREGFLATYYYTPGVRKIPQLRWNYPAMGMRRNEVRDCDAEGNYFFEGLPRNFWEQYPIAVKVYREDPVTGAINACTDLGKQAGDIQLVVDTNADVNPVRSLVFTCEEFSLLGLYDPRFLQALGEVQLMDARRNADPQRFDAMMYNQMIAGQLEPGSRANLLFRYGRVGNRLVLLNMPDDSPTQKSTLLPGGSKSQAMGFTIKDFASLEPLALASARDFFKLDDARLDQYRKAGVSSSMIDSMHARSKEQIDAATTALDKGDAAGVIKSATGAASDQARVYDATLAMANDVVRAAIFLLLLAVPFSFCMERLIVGTPSVYKQIAWTGGIFAIMAIALWMFHPAFKLSNSPLIIILAFAIILMSVMVITVVYSKFTTELKRIRSGRGTSQGASFASASVMMSAVMLGIANMRRRKFRTFLTSVTIVLITFAVLCFTSAQRYQGVISLPTGVDASQPGVLLRQRGFRPMPIESIDTLRAVFPDRQFVERWWTLSSGETKEMTNLVAGGMSVDGQKARVVGLQALLGLSPGESRLSQIASIVPNFDRLENGETNIIYLSTSSAEQLNVKQGDTIRIGGADLQVAGIYDATVFDQRVNMLSGEALSPLKYQSGMLDSSGKRLDTSTQDALDLDSGATASEAAQNYEHLSGSELAIVSSKFSQRLETSTLRTIGMRLKDDVEVKSVIEELTRRYALAIFAGYSDGVKLVSASNLSSIGGGAQVAIPLAIGGLIIFNTMMGSIAERRREIHVYTSLGLAPLHVGALFVAEAMTYGLIGSVFGYIIGQGVGTMMLKLGWLGNVTLNYSGTSAMLTLSLILLIVLLSALVPARLASKIAAPSIDRSWRVPAPKDNTIMANLPFTINKTAAEGVVGYLAEFFESHQEGSIGKFSAGKVEAFAGQADSGKPTRGLTTVVWLTPFDLGVRQHLMLLIQPGEYDEIYEVQVMLQRLSGDDGSWYRMNRSFLTELRKQFLQWRSLSPAKMKQYVAESKKLFAEVPETVVTTEPTESRRLG